MQAALCHPTSSSVNAIITRIVACCMEGARSSAQSTSASEEYSMIMYKLKTGVGSYARERRGGLDGDMESSLAGRGTVLPPFRSLSLLHPPRIRRHKLHRTICSWLRASFQERCWPWSELSFMSCGGCGADGEVTKAILTSSHPSSCLIDVQRTPRALALFSTLLLLACVSVPTVLPCRTLLRSLGHSRKHPSIT